VGEAEIFEYRHRELADRPTRGARERQAHASAGRHAFTAMIHGLGGAGEPGHPPCRLRRAAPDEDCRCDSGLSLKS